MNRGWRKLKTCLSPFYLPLGYDDTDELTSGSATGSSYGYTYDSGGNRLTETINGSTTTAKCNAVNELQQISPAKTGDKTYQWDAENRIVSISYTGTVQQTHLSYDGLGRCAQIQELNNGAVTATRRFLWCGAERCEERDAFDNVTKRFFNQGEQIWGQNYYYMKDHLGSIREMTDSTGAVRASYSYDFWGRRTKLIGNMDADFGFTGLFYHQTSQLCQAVFRSYDPNTGRWLSRDPYKDAESQVGPNLYDYVHNNPIEWLDPLGLVAYSAAQVQQIIANATQQILSTPVSQRAQLLQQLHGVNGPLDFYGNNNNENPDTFCVNGQSLNDDQFGNYLAGYDAYTAFGELGALAVHGVAAWFSATDVAQGIHPSFDFTQPDLNQGISDSASFFNDPEVQAVLE